MKKVIMVLTCIFVFHVLCGMTSRMTHPAFHSWGDYSGYFKGMKKHTGWFNYFIAWKEKGVWYFYDKNGKRCKL